jgi:hypothetical protein
MDFNHRFLEITATKQTATAKIGIATDESSGKDVSDCHLNRGSKSNISQ